MSEKEWIMESAEKNTKRSSYHHGDLRAKLIDATRVLVEEKGPDHFSVSEACRKAGVSTAAPYKHFKDKQEMLSEVAKEGMLRQREMLVAELALYPPATLERIVAMGRVYVRYAHEETGVFRLIFGLSERHNDDAVLKEMGDRVFDLVKGEVAMFEGRDVVTQEDENKAFLLWSFVHGLSFLQIDGKLEDKNLEIDLEAVLIDIAKRVMRD
ncbi:MAG: TetR/AcrR family transcriptional regulator [Roseobacter sp.]